VARSSAFLVRELDGGRQQAKTAAGDFARDADTRESWNQLSPRFGGILGAGNRPVKCAATHMAAADEIAD
jgi:hypothetical protein